MVKWMIPSITDGDWFPSATEQDQLKSMFGILMNTLPASRALYEAEIAQKELFNAVMSMTTKEGMETDTVERVALKEYALDTTSTDSLVKLDTTVKVMSTEEKVIEEMPKEPIETKLQETFTYDMKLIGK